MASGKDPSTADDLRAEVLRLRADLAEAEVREAHLRQSPLPAVISELLKEAFRRSRDKLQATFSDSEVMVKCVLESLQDVKNEWKARNKQFVVDSRKAARTVRFLVSPEGEGVCCGGCGIISEPSAKFCGACGRQMPVEAKAGPSAESATAAAAFESNASSFESFDPSSPVASPAAANGAANTDSRVEAMKARDLKAAAKRAGAGHIVASLTEKSELVRLVKQLVEHHGADVVLDGATAGVSSAATTPPTAAALSSSLPSSSSSAPTAKPGVTAGSSQPAGRVQPPKAHSSAPVQAAAPSAVPVKPPAARSASRPKGGRSSSRSKGRSGSRSHGRAASRSRSNAQKPAGSGRATGTTAGTGGSSVGGMDAMMARRAAISDETERQAAVDRAAALARETEERTRRENAASKKGRTSRRRGGAPVKRTEAAAGVTAAATAPPGNPFAGLATPASAAPEPGNPFGVGGASAGAASSAAGLAREAAAVAAAAAGVTGATSSTSSIGNPFAGSATAKAKSAGQATPGDPFSESASAPAPAPATTAAATTAAPPGNPFAAGGSVAPASAVAATSGTGSASGDGESEPKLSAGMLTRETAWIKASDAHGRVYFWHRETRERRWAMPDMRSHVASETRRLAHVKATADRLSAHEDATRAAAAVADAADVAMANAKPKLVQWAAAAGWRYGQQRCAKGVAPQAAMAKLLATVHTLPHCSLKALTVDASSKASILKGFKRALMGLHSDKLVGKPVAERTVSEAALAEISAARAAMMA